MKSLKFNNKHDPFKKVVSPEQTHFTHGRLASKAGTSTTSWTYLHHNQGNLQLNGLDFIQSILNNVMSRSGLKAVKISYMGENCRIL